MLGLRPVSVLLQVGRGTVSLATVYEHAYQESQVSIVTQEGKHVGEVDVFFVYASKEVCFYICPDGQPGWLPGKLLPALSYCSIASVKALSTMTTFKCVFSSGSTVYLTQEHNTSAHEVGCQSAHLTTNY